MEQVIVTISCMHCGKEFSVPMSEDQYNRLTNRFKTGELIQNILPDVSPEIRELFISRTCAKCWNDIMSFDEDDTNW